MTTLPADTFAALYENSFDSVRAMVARIVKDETLAEDLTQDAFAKLLTEDVSNVSNLRGFVFRTARNLALNHLDKRNIRRAEDSDAAPVAAEEAAPVDYDKRDALRDAVATLSPGLRDAMALHLDGHSNGEIARILGVPTMTVGTRLYNARKRLAEGPRRRSTAEPFAVLVSALLDEISAAVEPANRPLVCLALAEYFRAVTTGAKNVRVWRRRAGAILTPEDFAAVDAATAYERATGAARLDDAAERFQRGAFRYSGGWSTPHASLGVRGVDVDALGFYAKPARAKERRAKVGAK